MSIVSHQLQERLSASELSRLLEVKCESDSWDFKELRTNADLKKLARHVLAFANTEGGGHIVLGVEDRTYEPVGLPSDVSPIDTTQVHNALYEYINAPIDILAGEHAVQGDWSGSRRFGIIYVAEYDGIAVMSKDFQDTDAHGRPIVIGRSSILVRRGAASCQANQVELERLIQRQIWMIICPPGKTFCMNSSGAQAS
jgi:Putative DNA-binding domain